MHPIITAADMPALLQAARLRIAPTLREVEARDRHGLPTASTSITQLEASARIGRTWRTALRARRVGSIVRTLTSLHGAPWAVVVGDGWVAAGPSAGLLCALTGDGAQ